MNRNQINFIIGAVCVFVLLAFALAFFYISSQKDDSVKQVQSASDASGPEIMTLNSNASAPTAASEPEDNNTLGQLFTAKIIGSSKKMVEDITGKAISNEYGFSEYEVNGCRVHAMYDADGKLRNIGLDLSDSCKVNLSTFNVPNTEAGPNLTFGQISEALGSSNIRQFQSDCLMNCGNAQDPTVSAIYAIDSNPNEPEPMEILLKTAQVGDAALTASDKWRGAMLKQEDEDWVLNGEFNCDARYNSVAQELFNNVSVNSITIGYDIPLESCQSAAG